MAEHEPDCPLSRARWLGNEDGDPDGALIHALEALPDLDVWTDAGLSAALRRAAPPDRDRRLAWCTCRRR